MNKLFVISVDHATQDERDAFTAALRDRHRERSFWHHIESLWLMIDHSGELRAVALSEEVRALMPRATVLVIEANPVDYAAYAPPVSHRWLHELDPMHWRKR